MNTSPFSRTPLSNSIKKVAVMTCILMATFGCDKDDEKGAQQTKGSAKGFSTPPKEAGDADLYAPISETGVPVAPGSAIDLNNHKGIPNLCLDGKSIDVPQQEGFFSLDANFSRADLKQILGTSSGGSAKFLTWGASARASFDYTSRTQSKSINYLVFSYNKHHSKVFLPNARSETWKLATSEEWTQSCGDGYVAAQDFGSMILVQFSLQLTSGESDAKFSTSGSGNFLSFASLKASLSANQTKSRSSGSLSVSAVQIGGKPEELGKVLKRQSGEKGSLESFVMCDISDAAKCLEGLKAIEDYVADVFPKQIADKENGGGAVLRTYPFRYPKTIGGEFNPGVDQFVLKARKELIELYEAEMNDIAAFQSSKKKADEASQEMLELAKLNISNIRKAAELCYNTATYQACVAQAEDVKISCAETVAPEVFSTGSSEVTTGTGAGE
jgi:hypothetical protein